MSLGICKTNGKGHWSFYEKEIPVTGIEITYLDKKLKFGELIAYFDPTVWDITKLGLIYTDPQWILDFKNLLVSFGFSQSAVTDSELHYSEQGMQNVSYVSMDIGPTFITEALNHTSEHVKLNLKFYKKQG